MKTTLIIFITVFAFYSCSDIFGTSDEFEVLVKGEKIIKSKFPKPPPFGTYKINVLAVGKSDCELEYKLLKNGIIYKVDRLLSKSGKFTINVYSGEWYDSTPGLIIIPQSKDCNSKITIKYTYYH